MVLSLLFDENHHKLNTILFIYLFVIIHDFFVGVFQKLTLKINIILQVSTIQFIKKVNRLSTLNGLCNLESFKFYAYISLINVKKYFFNKLR